MEDIMNKDTYGEHVSYHQQFHSDCSSCFSERRLLLAHKTVNKSLLQELKDAVNSKTTDYLGHD